jgi:hypothetical protein
LGTTVQSAGQLPVRVHHSMTECGRAVGQILDHRETAVGLCRLSRAVCESVGGRRRDGAGILPISGIRSHRCLHTSGRGRAVGRILDHRETAMGLCRLSRAVCESMAERWRDGAGSLPTLGIRSHRCLHASWRKWWARPILDHRETATGLSRLPRAVCESVGERRRDGAGSLPILGIRSHRWLHT